MNLKICFFLYLHAKRRWCKRRLTPLTKMEIIKSLLKALLPALIIIAGSVLAMHFIDVDPGQAFILDSVTNASKAKVQSC